jgi:hypothetical protein
VETFRAAQRPLGVDDRRDEKEGEPDRRECACPRLVVEHELRGPGLGLREHDGEQDQDADRADVDEHLGGGDHHGPGEHVDAGQRSEREDHRETRADDVTPDHHEDGRAEHDAGKQQEEQVVPRPVEEGN